MARVPRLLFVVLLFAGLAVGLGGAGSVPSQPSDLAGLEAIAVQELKDTNTPGAAIALVRGDRVIFSKGFGVASVDTGGPVTPDMLFRLGSTTKMFTAAAVVSLAEEGRLRLDEPIGKRVAGLDPSIARLTAHQLLSHTAGLRDEAIMNGLHDDAVLAAGVGAMTRELFIAEPGRLFSYANPGFWIAGRLAEAVDGRPYADLMAARIFAPLGMTRTTVRPLMAMTWPLAQGHDLAGGKPAVLRPAADNVANWPAGSVFSSVEDLSRFVIAFLNEGRVDGKQALSPTLIRTLSTPYVDQPGKTHPTYGYGLTIVTRRGVRFVEHGGSRSGYGSTIVMAPGQKAGIVVVANRTGASLPKTVDRASELLLPLGPVVPEAPRPPIAMSRGGMERYVGRYAQSAGDAGISVAVKNDGLVLLIGAQETPIVMVGQDRFELVRPGGTRQDVWFVSRDGAQAEFAYRGTRALPRVKEVAR